MLCTFNVSSGEWCKFGRFFSRFSYCNALVYIGIAYNFGRLCTFLFFLQQSGIWAASLRVGGIGRDACYVSLLCRTIQRLLATLTISGDDVHRQLPRHTSLATAVYTDSYHELFLQVRKIIVAGVMNNYRRCVVIILLKAYRIARNISRLPPTGPARRSTTKPVDCNRRRMAPLAQYVVSTPPGRMLW